ncbi:MAG: VOC family protein [Chloroflexota bacterium]|nr:VOC family protein [Chloroflexota bacterium]
MTVSGPDFIGLQVRDVARAAAFYEQHLGLTRAPQSPPGAVVFTTQPIAFAVRQAAAGLDLDAVAPGVGVALWLKTDNAQTLHDELARAHIPITTDPFDGPFGRTFAFRDPDGYTITLHDSR